MGVIYLRCKNMVFDRKADIKNNFMQSRFVCVKCRLNRELSAGRKEALRKLFETVLAVHRSHPAAI